jgi:hypothetical protein
VETRNQRADLGGLACNSHVRWSCPRLTFDHLHQMPRKRRYRSHSHRQPCYHVCNTWEPSPSPNWRKRRGNWSDPEPSESRDDGYKDDDIDEYSRSSEDSEDSEDYDRSLSDSESQTGSHVLENVADTSTRTSSTRIAGDTLVPFANHRSMILSLPLELNCMVHAFILYSMRYLAYTELFAIHYDHRCFCCLRHPICYPSRGSTSF